MIDPITGLTLAAQTGAGVYQMYKGNKLAKEAEAMQQDYKTPQVIEDSLTNAQIRALEGMPAEMKAQYIQNLQNSTQSGINALSDRKASISGVEGLLRNEQGSYMNLASQDASMKQANQDNLQGVQQNVASYKDREYDLNVLQPYMAKLAAAAAMKGAGLQNVSTVLGSAAEMSQNKQLLNDIYGQNKQTKEQTTVDPVNTQINPIQIDQNLLNKEKLKFQFLEGNKPLPGLSPLPGYDTPIMKIPPSVVSPYQPQFPSVTFPFSGNKY